jgi:hypothetical protein
MDEESLKLSFRKRLDGVAAAVSEWTDLRTGERALRFDGWCWGGRRICAEFRAAHPDADEKITDPEEWARLSPDKQRCVAGYRVMCLLCYFAGLDRLPRYAESDREVEDVYGLLEADVLFLHTPDRFFEMWAIVADAIERGPVLEAASATFQQSMSDVDYAIAKGTQVVAGSLLSIRDQSSFLWPVPDAEYRTEIAGAYSIALWEGTPEFVRRYPVVQSKSGPLYVPVMLSDDPEVHTGDDQADLWLFRARALRDLMRGGYERTAPHHFTAARLKACGHTLWKMLRRDGMTLLKNIGGGSVGHLAELSQWLVGENPTPEALESAMASVVRAFPNAVRVKDESVRTGQLRSLIPHFHALAAKNKDVRLRVLLTEDRQFAAAVLGKPLVHTFCDLPSGKRRWMAFATTRTLELSEGVTLRDVFREAGRVMRGQPNAAKLLGAKALADDDYWLMLLFRTAWTQRTGLRFTTSDEFVAPGHESSGTLPTSKLAEFLEGHLSTLEPDPFTASVALIAALTANDEMRNASQNGKVSVRVDKRKHSTQEVDVEPTWTQKQLIRATKDHSKSNRSISATVFREVVRDASDWFGLRPTRNGEKNRGFTPAEIRFLLQAAQRARRLDAECMESAWEQFATTEMGE